ncbi:MAG: hypothetical protein Q4A61_03870 [Porphyromonadaceae bacterium]|nr:hypothetical protein [Porphyromonadaceae bacterium]
MNRIILFIALAVFGLSACKKDVNEPQVQLVAEIVIGEGEGEEIVVLDKGDVVDKALKGGNGKFTATVEDSKILEAKIEGNYLKLRGLNYGMTKVSVRSHDKQKTLTVRVDRPEISLSEAEVTLLPGEVRKNITVRGGGDDAEFELVNPEGAIEARWEARTGVLELVGKYEGEAMIIFRSKDDKPAKEIKIKVKATNDVSDAVGFYSTKSQTLRPDFPVVLHAYRPGKMVWISASTDMTNQAKTRLRMAPLKSPEKGAKVTQHITFVSVGQYESGEYPLIIEEVRTAEGLVTLRGQGFKLVVPFDK